MVKHSPQILASEEKGTIIIIIIIIIIYYCYNKEVTLDHF